MPWEVCEAVLAQALIPLADPTRQPEAFYAGFRLVGIDGTQFSCGNTPRILGTMTKAPTRRFEAAFAKLGCAVLVELGTHAPLAAALSAPDLGESEAALAGQLLGRLPVQSMRLGDRLYGNGALVGRLLACSPAGPAQAFLRRVSQTPRPPARQDAAGRQHAGGSAGGPGPNRGRNQPPAGPGAGGARSRASSGRGLERAWDHLTARAVHGSRKGGRLKLRRWQCQGEPVLRDMAPDRVPVPLHM